MRGSPCFRQRGDGFKPDEARPGLGKPMIAADGQFTRRAVFCSIGSFHGLKRNAVGRLPPGKGQWLEKGGNILFQRDKTVDFI